MIFQNKVHICSTLYITAMENPYWESFQEYALSPEETQQIRGGGQYLNQQVLSLLCEQNHYQIPIQEWEHADYRYWAHHIGISINTLKRWLQEGKTPQKNAQDQLLTMLNYPKWSELEEYIILKKGDKTK